jgi:diguanylate cyclase (GGDEF)-like protein
VHRSPNRPWLITWPLLVFAAAASVPVILANHQPLRNIGYMPIFVLMFTVAGMNLLRFDVRRQGMTVSLVDLPLLLALFYLPPLGLLIAGPLGAALTRTISRTGFVKLSFNVASYAAGCACANLVVLRFGIEGTGPRTWAVLAAAVYAQTQTMLLAVVGVITLVEGWAQARKLWRSAFIGIVVTAINIVIGLIIVLALRANGWSALLLVGLFGMAYRTYAQFVRQHRSLAELYELTQALATSGEGTLFDVLLSRVRQLLQAESATLWLPAQGRHPEVLLSARVDYQGLLDSATTPDEIRQQAVASCETVVVTAKLGADDLRAQLGRRGVKDAVVVPLRSGGVAVGTLEVAGRLGDSMSFRNDDVRLMETLSAHAAIAVENSRLVDRLRFDASHDLLTGLPNRRRMLEALTEAIMAPAVGDVVAVLLFDVVDLRQVNESLGQAAGDEALIEVASRLRRLSPAGAMLARVGGDEFVLEIRISDLDAAQTMAEEIRERLRDRLTIGLLTVDIDTSVGIAVHPDHGDTAEVLLRRAEVAAQAAKRRTAVQLFGQGMESRSLRRLGLAGELRRALDTGGIQVHFQPKVALADRRLVGVECLARWEHPVHGQVAPQDIVAVAEHTGELPRFTEVVLREGLYRAREWADGGRHLSVSVNVAVRTLLDTSFPDLVRRLLEEYGVVPDRLVLEITEPGMAPAADRPLPNLHRLHELGVRLSIDDFGTGSSSLSHLRRLPVQEIKIDQTFVQGATTDAKDLAIVRTIVDMARHFGLVVVAEGVESELTLGVLEDVGCELGQGFLFSRPLPYERLDTWLGGQLSPDSAPAGDVRWLRAVP